MSHTVLVYGPTTLSKQLKLSATPTGMLDKPVLTSNLSLLLSRAVLYDRTIAKSCDCVGACCGFYSAHGMLSVIM